MNKQLKEELSQVVYSPVKWDCPLRDYTSFRIGGPAHALVTAMNLEELQALLQFIDRNEVLYRVIGRGTNLLVRDQGYSGIAIVLSGDFKQYSIEESESGVFLDAGAGCSFTRLSTICMEKGLSGMEFAIGIPGTLGGAAVMNAGAWGFELADILQEITVMTPQGTKKYARYEVDFTYRKMVIHNTPDAIVTSVRLMLGKREIEEIRKTCENYREQRFENQPIGTANAGSIFKNPEGASAGQLIEASGLKGVAIGDAIISEKHANFIVNRGTATAGDVLELIALIQKRVKADSGVQLEPEVHIL